MATISGGTPVQGKAWTSTQITGQQVREHLRAERGRGIVKRSEQRRRQPPVRKAKPRPKPRSKPKTAKPLQRAKGPTTISRGTPVAGEPLVSTQMTAQQVREHLRGERGRGMVERAEARQTKPIPVEQPPRSVAAIAPIPRTAAATPREEAAWTGEVLKKGEKPKGPLPPEVMALLGLS